MKRIIESITQALLEMEIFEMAHQRKNVVQKVQNLATHIATHITKVALYPDHSARKHWENEIDAAVYNIKKNVYDGKKRLKDHEYFHHLYTAPIEDTDFTKDTISDSIHQDGMPDRKWSDTELSGIDNKIKPLYQILSKQIADNKFIGIKSIMDDAGI